MSPTGLLWSEKVTTRNPQGLSQSPAQASGWEPWAQTRPQCHSLA